MAWPRCVAAPAAAAEAASAASVSAAASAVASAAASAVASAVASPTFPAASTVATSPAAGGAQPAPWCERGHRAVPLVAPSTSTRGMKTVRQWGGGAVVPAASSPG